MSPQFRYQAKEGPNRVVDGVIDADNYNQAVNEIVLKGLTPIILKENSRATSSKQPTPQKQILPSRGKKISPYDLVVLTRQMSDLLDSGVQLLTAIQLVGNRTKNKELTAVIDQIKEDIQNGVSFSQGLSRHENIFSSYYVNMVRAGEIGGKLNLILDRLAGYLEKEHEIAGKVKSSLAYPAFVLGVGFITIFVMLSFVIPRLTIMFEDFEQSLPLITTVLLQVSRFFVKFWWTMILMIVVGIKYFRQWAGTTGKTWMDAQLIRVWIIGPFIQTVEVGRFARTLGTLIESGVPIVTALETVINTVDNTVLKKELAQAAADVSAGSSLGNALQKVSFFPEMAVNMIAIGEESGRFEKGLYKIADVYERESENMMKTAVSILGPAVLTIVIVFVGFIVIAVMLPILQMNQLIK
ncbi:MAG: type II secretion system F family protein [Candidatus Omnitrophica bacterium]|nr:type II secretion system F family protein [Candidatus Omnitrophota bacterium]